MLRDHNGSVIHVFSHFYGPGMNTMGDGRALLDGLRMAYAYHPLRVECDSSYVVDHVTRRCATSWSSIYIIRQCQTLISSVLITHVYREANHIVVALLMRLIVTRDLCLKSIWVLCQLTALLMLLLILRASSILDRLSILLYFSCILPEFCLYTVLSGVVFFYFAIWGVFCCMLSPYNALFFVVFLLIMTLVT